MNDEAHQQSTQDRSPTLKDQMELLKFLREEAEANRKAQREEAEANRQLLTDTLKIVSPILAVVIAVAAFLWFHDLATLKEAIRNEGEAEAKIEIKKMDKQIDDTLQSQFQREEIQRTIRNAAEIAAQKEAKPLIEAGVKSEVREAVSQQEGTIRKIAEQAVSSEVRETIKPLANRVGENIAQQHIHELIELANADDALAFDEMVQLKDTGPPSQRTLIASVIADRRVHAFDKFRADGQEPLSKCGPGDDARLHSGSVVDRIQAMADCSGWLGREHESRFDTAAVLNIELTITPEIVKITLDDSSLAVRAAAISFVNTVFFGSPGFRVAWDLDKEKLRNWWSENEHNYRALELYSGGRFPLNQDLVVFYDELSRVAATSPAALAESIQEMLARMRKKAADMQDTPSELKERLGRDTCIDVENDFGLRKEYDSDSYSFLEIEYLQKCPIVRSFMPRIVDYATTSRFLYRRYAATAVLNGWVGEKFDPFKPSSIRDWWLKHKAEYEN